MPVPDTAISDADMYFFHRFYEENYGISIEETGLSAEKAMTNLKLAKGEHLTLAGLLLFGKRPEIIRPQYLVKAVAFAGNDITDTEYLDSEDMGGPLSVVFKNSRGFLTRSLRKQQKGQGFNSLGILEIPEIAME